MRPGGASCWRSRGRTEVKLTCSRRQGRRPFHSGAGRGLLEVCQPMPNFSRGLLAIVLLLLSVRTALACGEWSLQDEERGQLVQFYIRSTFLHSGARAPGEPPHNRILLLEGDSAEKLHSEAGGRPQLAMAGTTLQLHGKAVGELRGSELRLGRAVYQILISRNPQIPADSDNPQGRWLVEVRRGEQRLAHGRAMAMCLGGALQRADAEQEAEVRLRVTYYLAWRELLSRGRPVARPGSASSATSPPSAQRAAPP